MVQDSFCRTIFCHYLCISSDRLTDIPEQDFKLKAVKPTKIKLQICFRPIERGGKYVTDLKVYLILTSTFYKT